MHLSKIKIRNYRCFGDSEQTINVSDLTSFIGTNSSGKTTALLALNCLFSSNSSDRILRREDFYLPKNVSPESITSQNLYIETIFTFDKSEDSSLDEKTIPIFYNHFVVDEPGGTPYLRIRLEATWEKSNNIDGAIESHVYYITCPESEAISENSKKCANRKDLDRIRVLYVPAIRDPSKQLKLASGTILRQIMDSIIWSDETRNNVKNKIEEINNLFLDERGVSMLDASIHDQWKEYDSDVRYTNAKLYFCGMDVETSLRKSEVIFSPSISERKCTIDDMSDGLRSLFYISLVDSLLDIEAKANKESSENITPPAFSFESPILTIIALEEPENHIAPHLLGKLISNLNEISQKKNAQVILTSHSPSILKRIDPGDLRYFRIDAETYSTEVHSILLPDKEKLSVQYKFIKEAVKAYPELYFAKLVILGEGDSEEIILPKFWEKKYGDVDTSGISIVPLGGRFVNHFWRLLSDLKIPYVTLLDLDKEREGGGWGRIKYVLDQLIILGENQDTLLCPDESTKLSKDDLKNMHTWKVADSAFMNILIKHLEKYHVFFSAPLDIDFLMLESFPTDYKGILSSNEGPRLMILEKGERHNVFIKEIEDSEQSNDEYLTRIEHDVRCTLKDCGGDGKTYTENQKRLMVWYNYFFLNRGKPTTHIEFFSQLSNDVLISRMPPVLSRLISDAQEILKGD